MSKVCGHIFLKINGGRLNCSKCGDGWEIKDLPGLKQEQHERMRLQSKLAEMKKDLAWALTYFDADDHDDDAWDKFTRLKHGLDGQQQ